MLRKEETSVLFSVICQFTSILLTFGSLLHGKMSITRVDEKIIKVFSSSLSGETLVVPSVRLPSYIQSFTFPIASLQGNITIIR